MKASPKTFRALADLVEKGLSPTRAGRILHLAPSTISAWRREFPDFNDMIEDAESRFVERMTDCIAAAAPKDWRAAVEILARRFPGEFSASAGSNRDSEALVKDQLEEMIAMARSPYGRSILLKGGVIDEAWLKRHLPNELLLLAGRTVDGPPAA